MKRKIFYTTRFKKDLKRYRNDAKRRQNITRVIDMLSEGKEIPRQMRPHPLKGDYVGHMELHIESDLLLIWCEITDDGNEVIHLERIGSHSDLF